VAVYVGPALLLVRSSHRRGWHLPGGGVKRGEMPEIAARAGAGGGDWAQAQCCWLGLYMRELGRAA
jgi:hypothetical protein